MRIAGRLLLTSRMLFTVRYSLLAIRSQFTHDPLLTIRHSYLWGFRSGGAQIGDVYLSTKCVFHARRIPEMNGHLSEYGYGHYRSPPLGRLVAQLDLKQGVLSTSDSLDCSPIDLQLMQTEGAAVKEMEGAAIAWVCSQLNVPFVAVKSITDIVDGGKPTEDEFYQNLKKASEQLQTKLTAVILMVADKPYLAIFSAIYR